MSVFSGSPKHASHFQAYFQDSYSTKDLPSNYISKKRKREDKDKDTKGARSKLKDWLMIGIWHLHAYFVYKFSRIMNIYISELFYKASVSEIWGPPRLTACDRCYPCGRRAHN